MVEPTIRIAIIGAGPAGIYAADLLHRAPHNLTLAIDLFEQLPAPYGLVRYGVAPDHPRIKGIISALREVLDNGAIRYFGNVRYGTDITLSDLRRHYHAVIFATGAIHDQNLAIPGISATGSFGAADFVSWFDGHPDVPRSWPLAAQTVGVIGNGNVALDISRMLIKHAADLLPTEIPDNVYQGLRENPITDLHLFGRRGPKYVKFTPLELRELGEVRDVDMVLNENDFTVPDPYADAAFAKHKQVTVLTRILQKWRDEQAQRASGELPAASRRLHLHFWSRPVEVISNDGQVSGLKIERTLPDGAGGIIGSGQFTTVPMQALYRAVGYAGSELPEIPFDVARKVIPNAAGRVLAANGEHLAGIYTTGWIKRGPVGLIGHTKSDAMETLESLLADRATWWQPAAPDPAEILQLLTARNVKYTTIAGWHRLDEHELALGAAAGRTRIKVVSRKEMTAISRGETT